MQEVAYNIPRAIVAYDQEAKNDIFKILKDKLTEYFSPKRSSTSNVTFFEV